jgi:hypothetical protein
VIRSLLVIIAVLFAVDEMAGQHPVQYIENETIRAGVLTGIGGRIVYFGLKDRGNVLKTDTSLWHDTGDQIPSLDDVNTYKTYHGHVVWVSPMADWWSQQDIFPQKKGDRWPPDPYLIYGKNTIQSQTDRSLQWQGPDSPYTGVRLLESMTLADGNSLKFSAEALNIREESISWSLWLNTRFEGMDQCYVKIRSQDDIRINDVGSAQNNIPHGVVDGYFTFFPAKVNRGADEVKTKTYITSETPYLYAFHKNQAFVMKFEMVEPSALPPGHAAVEIYNQIMPHREQDLLELEVHSRYLALQPGDSVSIQVTWWVFPYDGVNEPRSHVAFIRSELTEKIEL